MENNKEMEIDLKKIFAMLRQKAIYIILTAVIGAVVSGCVTNFFITPQYTATIKMHAWSNSDNLLGNNSSITSSEYQASEMLVNTYLVVVTSDTYLEKVAKEIGGGITAKQIKGMMSCSPIEDTIAFKISITCPDAKKATEIVNVIADTCPDEIVRVVKVGGVEVIDYARYDESNPPSPSSPSMKKNILIGFIVGFALSFLVFFIKDLYDTSINSEEDLARDFNIPILGTVPKLVAVKDRSKLRTSADIEPPRPSIINDEKEGK